MVWGVGKQEETGSIQTSSYKMTKSENLMQNMTTANNTAMYI